MITAAGIVYVLAAGALFVVLTAAHAITRRPYWCTAVVPVAFALLGSALYLLTNQPAFDDVSRIVPAHVTLIGAIASDVEVRGGAGRFGRRTAQCVVRAQRMELDAGIDGGKPVSFAVSGSVQTYLALTSESEDVGGAVSHVANAPGYGDVVRVRGVVAAPDGARNPGAFDNRAYLARRGIHATLSTHRPEDWRIVRGPDVAANPLLRLAFLLRRGVLDHARRALPPLQAGVLNGILLGERGDLPGSLNLDFERTGASHVLATAGLHVGMVVGLLLGFMRLFRIGKRPALLIAVLLLALYAIMAGGRPSVSRAVIMASVYLLGIYLEREPNLTNTMALAALILLVMNPQNLFDAGFQLSFATVACIALLMPLAEETLAGVRRLVPGKGRAAGLARRAAEAFAACFFLAAAAQIGAGPLVAYYYHNVSFVTLVANTLVVPLIAFVIALGFSAATLGACLLWLSWPLDLLLKGFLSLITGIVTRCAALPGASVATVSPPEVAIALYYAVIWALARLWRPAGNPAGRSSRSREEAQ